jgi:hypothetical protein
MDPNRYFGLIEKHRTHLSAEEMCDAFSVSRSSYYRVLKAIGQLKTETLVRTSERPSRKAG